MLVVNSVTDTTSAIIYTIAANLPPKVKKASKHGQNFQCKKLPKRADAADSDYVMWHGWYKGREKRIASSRHSRLEMTSNFIYFSFKVF